MGGKYIEYISNRKPEDEMYDWPITGIPGEILMEEGSDSTPDGSYSEERWKETKMSDIWVSNFGRFYNTRTNKFVKPTHGDGQGHKAVKANGRQEYAHRLIAEMFIDNSNNDPIVRHLDDDKENNDLSNLAWGTQLDNHMDCVRNGNYIPVSDEARKISVELTRHPVEATNVVTGEKLYFRSQGEASRKLGIPQANIWKVIAGERKHAKGYSFKEVEKEACNG